MHARPDQILSDGSECAVAMLDCGARTVVHVCVSHGNHSTV